MALEYLFMLPPAVEARGVLRLLRSCLGDSTNYSPESLEFGGESIYGSLQPARRKRVWMRESGSSLADGIRVYFRLDKFDTVDGLDCVARCVSCLLRAQSGDALLTLNFETPILLRENGVLQIADGSELATPERLALFDPPYVLGKLASSR